VISPGEKAPNFSLANHEGIEVSLADFRGDKVVLVFYPLDFSPVCSDQLSVYQEVLPQVDEAGATLIGISVDSSWSHRAFREKLGLTMTLLSDFEPKGEVARAYGAYLDKVGHGNRSLVLIDEDGVVQWVHESPTPVQIPGANLIFDALAQASPSG
jgi:peroxiredoxin (alkyl hydroperoxide reductase subunit C)